MTQANEIDGTAKAWNNGRPMECPLALIADAANREEGGKLNILGVFDVIFADKFPYRMPQFYVVVRLTAGPAEFGLKKDVEMALLDPDGHVIGERLKASGSVPSPQSSGRASLEIILRMVGVPFEKPGQYAIAVLVGGEEKASISLDVVKKPAKKGRKRGK